jgi:hypothetical protein
LGIGAALGLLDEMLDFGKTGGELVIGHWLLDICYWKKCEFWLFK